MKYRELGETGIIISEVGYGAAGLFGKNVSGKPAINDEQAYELIATAINNGINFFDTGINYGYAEERLGKCISLAIQNKIVSRNDLVIETKCGETLNADGSYGKRDLSSDWIKKSLDISLKRLNLEYVDLFALHGECDKKNAYSLAETFREMKEQGKIRAYGVNTFDTNFLEWVAKEKCFDYVMLDYNILRQDREPLIEKLKKAGVGVIAGSALGESLFSKKIFRIKNRNDLWYLLRALVRFRKLMKKGRKYKFLNTYKDFTANQLALRYVLDNNAVDAACFSTTKICHMCENLKAVNMDMPENIRKKIKSIV